MSNQNRIQLHSNFFVPQLFRFAFSNRLGRSSAWLGQKQEQVSPEEGEARAKELKAGKGRTDHEGILKEMR